MTNLGRLIEPTFDDTDEPPRRRPPRHPVPTAEPAAADLLAEVAGRARPDGHAGSAWAAREAGGGRGSAGGDGEPTAAELIAFYDEHETEASLGAVLAGIRHTVREDGVTVTVDVHGKVVGLAFDGRAMRSRGAELAGRVLRLAATATAAALGAAMAALGPRLTPELRGHLAELLETPGR